ncbi:PFDN1 (predicted) [Pycnogonum litorale]
MAANLPVDMELKKAFQDLQKKMIDTAQSIKMADIQIDGSKRTIQHSNLTHAEVATLPEGTRTYEGIGRMFILRDIETIRDNLKKKITKSEEKISNLKSNQSYLENSLKESENNIREMIMSKNRNKSEA